jgi:hypothetical protein
MPRRTRIDPADVRECHAAGMKDAAVGRLLGCTRRNVALIRRQLGLPSANKRNRPWTETDDRDLRTLAAAGVTPHEIARQIGRTVEAVWHRLRTLKRETL